MQHKNPTPENNSTEIRILRTTRILAVILAVAGMHHGFFEVLQGNHPTPGFFIDSIGEAQRTWKYGGDGAITLIPNFLYTGLAAMAVGLAIILWVATGLTYRKGSTTLLGLFVLLTLTGGGIGHVAFFVPVWAFHRFHFRIKAWWNGRMPRSIQRFLGRGWLPVTLLSGILFLLGLEISVFGYVPGIEDPENLLKVCWGCLLLGLILVPAAYAGAMLSSTDPRPKPSYFRIPT